MKPFKVRAYFSCNDIMYYSDREEDEGEGIICWSIDHRGIVISIPTVIDRCPGGIGHIQEVNYVDYTIDDAVIFMCCIGIDDLYVGDIFGKANSTHRYLVEPNGLFREVRTRKDYTFKEMCMLGWCPKVLGNKYQNQNLLEYYPNGTFVTEGK